MPTKIAFVSCAYASMRPTQPAWGQILDAEPDLLLMLGDNAYMSWEGDAWDFQALEDCYRKQFEITDFKRLIDRVPTLAIWDDHDCGPNDTLGAVAPPDYLATTREKFDRWMGFARNNNRPQMYCTYNDLPDVQVIMLDVRTWRTASKPEPATLLGPAQEQWLWQQLDVSKTPPRKITIVAAGTCFTDGAGGQTISDYTTFAETLKSRLAFRAGDNPPRRALLLGGDIHRNTFRSDPSGFHEANSSGVACFQSGFKQRNADSEADNWGLITIGDEFVDVDFHGNDKPPAKPKYNPKNPPPKRITIADWTAANRPAEPAAADGPTPA